MFPLPCDPLRTPRLFTRSWSWDFFEMFCLNTKWCGSIRSDTICCAWMWYDHDIPIADDTIWSLLLIRSDMFEQDCPDRVHDRVQTRDIIRSSRSRFSIWYDVTRAYTFWCVHLEPIRSVVTGYDCGPDVFQFPHQGYPRFELRLDPKGIYTVRLTIDFIVSFKISYDWNQDMIWAYTRVAISPR